MSNKSVSKLFIADDNPATNALDDADNVNKSGGSDEPQWANLLLSLLGVNCDII